MSDYYCAARDSEGHIRLNCGRGLLVARSTNTRADVQGWLDRATDPRFAAQYRAALALLDGRTCPEAATADLDDAPEKDTMTTTIERIIEKRTIHYRLTGAPPTPRNDSVQSGRRFQPEKASVLLSRKAGQPWNLDGLRTEGHLIMDDGTVHDLAIGSAAFPYGNDAPGWLSSLATEAVAVTS